MKKAALSTRIEESKFVKLILNKSPGGDGEVYEAGMGNNAQTIE